MAKDLLVDDQGDLVVDPITNDLATVDGADEIAQRVRATLLIKYDEMPNLAPNQGADYTNFLGKQINFNLAKADMASAIEANVPEVVSIDAMDFVTLPNRQLQVNFTVTANTSNNTTESVEGGLTVGN